MKDIFKAPQKDSDKLKENYNIESIEIQNVTENDDNIKKLDNINTLQTESESNNSIPSLE